MKIYLAVLAILGWFALAAQFYINITSGVAGTPEIVTRYFSYFTITTNLLVAVCCTTLLLTPHSGWGRFFSRPTTLTAIAVYILIVGLIYNLILRFLWKPEGLQRVVDELLHSVIPVLFLICWLLFVVKDQLKWKDVLPWLLYPLVYIVFIFIRGAASGFYPYPFIDVSQLGLQKTLINAVGIAIVILVASLLLVGIGKFMGKSNKK
jgi:hypothetical protein